MLVTVSLVHGFVTGDKLAILALYLPACRASSIVRNFSGSIFHVLIIFSIIEKKTYKNISTGRYCDVSSLMCIWSEKTRKTG